MFSRKKIWLVVVLGIMVIALTSVWYFWRPRQTSTLSKEEQAVLLQEYVQKRIQAEYYQKMIPIYEKIVENDPNNEEIKKTLVEMKKALEEFEASPKASNQ